MRRQEITPWSIYNQTIVNQKEQGSQQNPKHFIRFPKIDNSSNRRQKYERSRSKQRLSARIHYQSAQTQKQQFIPYASQFPQREEAEGDEKAFRQAEIIQKQQQISRASKQYLTVRLIRQELKREASDFDFLHILKQEEEQDKQLPTLEIIKKERSYLLDRRVLPRSTIQRNMVLVNCSQEGDRGKDQKDVSQDIIKQILKKQISSMISNRMKIMGKAKEISYKH